MDRVWRPKLFLAIALTLSSGCARSFVTSQRQAHRDGMPNAFDTAAARGEMLTVMIGDPFPGSKEALERAVASALGRHCHGPPTRFAIRTTTDSRMRYNLILMFDPPRALPAAALCGDTGGLPAPELGSAFRVLAAFCERDLIYSEATASGPAPTSPGRPGPWRFDGGCNSGAPSLHRPLRGPGLNERCNA